MAASPNVLLAFPDYMGGVADGLSVTPVLSGGSWQLTAPLAGLTSRFLAYRARSNGCSLASTQLVIDLGQPRAIYAVAIPQHNLTKTGRYVISAYLDAALTQLVNSATGQAVTSSGQLGAVMYKWGDVPFEHDSWWDGLPTDEAYARARPPVLAVLGSGVVARYLLIQLIDPANPAGYVEISRPIVAPGYQPSNNVKYGAGLQVVDATIVTPTLGGARMYDKRQKSRTFHGQIDYLPLGEAFANIFDMYLQQGVSCYGFFCYDPTDSANLARWSFPATFSQLDPLTAAACGYTGITISIQEVTA